jgi:hypothetical protein
LDTLPHPHIATIKKAWLKTIYFHVGIYIYVYARNFVHRYRSYAVTKMSILWSWQSRFLHWNTYIIYIYYTCKIIYIWSYVLCSRTDYAPVWSIMFVILYRLHQHDVIQSGVGGWDTTLQAVRSRVRFCMEWLRVLINLKFPAAL